MNLTVLHQISYGMYVVGAEDNGRPVGCVANTFTQVTSENPIVAICLNKQNYTYEVIHRAGRFSLSILSEETDPLVIAQFGFSSGRDKNKFDRFDYQMRDGLPYLREKTCGSLTCQVLSEADMDTHVMIFARLVDTAEGDKFPPMTYAYYHSVVKGKAPKSAPTFQITDNG